MIFGKRTTPESDFTAPAGPVHTGRWEPCGDFNTLCGLSSRKPAHLPFEVSEQAEKVTCPTCRAEALKWSR